MPQTIESFVEKLQSEGVDAGKKAADKLLTDAKAQAEQVLADAKAQAERIIAVAKADMRRSAEQQRSELDLAARDMVLKLREGVGNAISALLRHEARQALTDKQFLATLIHDVAIQYAHDDAHDGANIIVNVNESMREEITTWAIAYIGQANLEQFKANIDLKSNLKTQGFEYSIGESTVEVTVESVVEVLKEITSPTLRGVLDRAFSGVAKPPAPGK